MIAIVGQHVIRGRIALDCIHARLELLILFGRCRDNGRRVLVPIAFEDPVTEGRAFPRRIEASARVPWQMPTDVAHRTSPFGIYSYNYV